MRRVQPTILDHASVCSVRGALLISSLPPHRQEGVAALWTGLGPNVARNAIINAVELASYDEVKSGLKTYAGMEEGAGLHLLSGKTVLYHSAKAGIHQPSLALLDLHHPLPCLTQQQQPGPPPLSFWLPRCFLQV